MMNLLLHVKTALGILLLFQTGASHGTKGDINNTDIYCALQTKYSAGSMSKQPCASSVHYSKNTHITD
jgi:hypothetical protein